MSRFVTIPGFYPINWHAWHRHTGQRAWTRDEIRTRSLLLWRLRLLANHRRFLR